MKKTKIVCTIGPACYDKKSLEEMALAGMSTARVNMSHGSISSLQEIINNVKEVREALSIPISLMADTKGPEIRLGLFDHGGVILKSGQLFTLTKRQIEGDETIASVSYGPLIDEINVGEKIYANNGMLVLKVKTKNEDNVVCKVLFGGKLTSRKGLNAPTIKIRSYFLSQQDQEDIIFAIKNGVEFISASFVSRPEDVIEMRKYLDDNGGDKIKIISKIENADGIKNIEKIIDVSDGIMIARGDLGVEIPLEKIPHLQKRIIKLCNAKGKTSIVATEMLESMTTSVRPTRAEVSDVATAIYDGASATMLSGETAIGINPVSVVKMMEKIICETEKNILYDKEFSLSRFKTLSVPDSIAEATCKNAIGLNAKGIVVFTNTGSTAFLISRFRTKTPVLALTPEKTTYNALSLCWNTVAGMTQSVETEDEMIEKAKELAKRLHFAKENDMIIVVTGTPEKSGSTNMIKIITI